MDGAWLEVDGVLVGGRWGWLAMNWGWLAMDCVWLAVHGTGWLWMRAGLWWMVGLLAVDLSSCIQMRNGWWWMGLVGGGWGWLAVNGGLLVQKGSCLAVDGAGWQWMVAGWR